MKGRRRWLADWRSVRVWEGETRELLRRRHALWLHGWCIGLLVLLAMWGIARLQLAGGADGSLALRYLLTLGAGYVTFLLVLRLWAGTLVGERPIEEAADAAELGLEVADAMADGLARMPGPSSMPAIQAGGVDAIGSGAQAGFGELPDAGSAVGEIASGAVEAASGADEGAVVVVPVVVVFLAGCLVVLGFGSLLLLYFGSEVLLAVAVEVAFGYVSARTAVRMAREGWLTAAVRLTWKPLLGALVCAVLLGGLIDLFLPAADSLPHAIQLLRQGR